MDNLRIYLRLYHIADTTCNNMTLTGFILQSVVHISEETHMTYHFHLSSKVWGVIIESLNNLWRDMRCTGSQTRTEKRRANQTARSVWEVEQWNQYSETNVKIQLIIQSCSISTKKCQKIVAWQVKWIQEINELGRTARTTRTHMYRWTKWIKYISQTVFWKWNDACWRVIRVTAGTVNRERFTPKVAWSYRIPHS